MPLLPARSASCRWRAKTAPMARSSPNVGSAGAREISLKWGTRCERVCTERGFAPGSTRYTACVDDKSSPPIGAAVVRLTLGTVFQGGYMRQGRCFSSARSGHGPSQLRRPLPVQVQANVSAQVHRRETSPSSRHLPPVGEQRVGHHPAMPITFERRGVRKDFPPLTTVQGYFYQWRDRWTVGIDQPPRVDAGARGGCVRCQSLGRGDRRDHRGGRSARIRRWREDQGPQGHILTVTD